MFTIESPPHALQMGVVPEKELVRSNFCAVKDERNEKDDMTLKK